VLEKENEGLFLENKLFYQFIL